MRAFVCGRDQRVTRLDWNGGAPAWHDVLDGEPVACVAADGDRVLVGTQGGGLLVSEDGGERWERLELSEPDVLSVAIGAADGALYAGTEPSRIFVCRDNGSWRELEALQKIPSRERWSFPPRPWTHHVRWIAPDPHLPERLLVGIELGGVMLSEDGGRSRPRRRPRWWLIRGRRAAPRRPSFVFRGPCSSPVPPLGSHRAGSRPGIIGPALQGTVADVPLRHRRLRLRCPI